MYDYQVPAEFNVGDLVQFISGEEEMYSYEVPKTGTFGIIELQSYSHGLEQMLGVKIPMSIVQWEGDLKIAVFSHDIKKPVLPVDISEKIVKRIKNYSGSNTN